MSYAIVYSTHTNNTALLAETIHSTLPDESCVYFGAPDPKALAAERIYVGFWTDQGTCNAEIQEFLRQLTSQEVFLFGTAGFGGSTKYFDDIIHNVSSLLPEGVRVIGSFMCQGKMHASVRERYVQMSHSPNPQPNLDMLIANFDQALTHPDQQDLENLKKALI